MLARQGLYQCRNQKNAKGLAEKFNESANSIHKEPEQISGKKSRTKLDHLFCQYPLLSI